MTKKKIILTFDYELFFGKKSGTIENCLIKPTDLLLKLLKQYGVRVTFFVDILFYKKLLDINNKEDIVSIKEQIKYMIKNGHRVELHLHPHWLDAYHDGKKWNFKHYDKYRIHNLQEDEMLRIFREGKFLLETIAKEVDKNYVVKAFRAGGWCIQPFYYLKPAFIENNIRIDSSVAYGIKGKSKAHSFNFVNIPNKEFYFFENSVEEEINKGSFLEVPISTYRTNILVRIWNKLKKIFFNDKYNIYGDGEGISLKKNVFKEIVSYEMFTLENMEPKRLYKLCYNYQKNIINIISHPKGLSKISFESLEYLIKSGRFDFITLVDLYNKLRR